MVLLFDTARAFNNRAAQGAWLQQGRLAPRMFVIVARGHGVVGCVGLRHRGAAEGELVRMGTLPHTRGLGLGEKLVAALVAEAHARGAGWAGRLSVL